MAIPRAPKARMRPDGPHVPCSRSFLMNALASAARAQAGVPVRWIVFALGAICVSDHRVSPALISRVSGVANADTSPCRRGNPGISFCMALWQTGLAAWPRKAVSKIGGRPALPACAASVMFHRSSQPNHVPMTRWSRTHAIPFAFGTCALQIRRPDMLAGAAAPTYIPPRTRDRP